MSEADAKKAAAVKSLAIKEQVREHMRGVIEQSAASFTVNALIFDSGRVSGLLEGYCRCGVLTPAEAQVIEAEYDAMRATQTGAMQ